MQLVVERAVATFVNPQLAGQFHLEITPNDLIAYLEYQIWISVKVAFVEHEQVATLIHKPLKLIDKSLGRPDSPIKSLCAKSAARPPATPTGDYRRQLIVVIVSVDIEVVPLVTRMFDQI